MFRNVSLYNMYSSQLRTVPSTDPGVSSSGRKNINHREGNIWNFMEMDVFLIRDIFVSNTAHDVT